HGAGYLFFLYQCARARVLHSFPTRRSSDLASSSACGSWSRSTALRASTLAATSIPLWPMGEPTAATFCQLCPGLPEAKQTVDRPDRKSTRLNSSHVKISYAVFCLKKKRKIT